MGRPAAANGFDDVENGFEPGANGFPDAEGLAPKRLSPRLMDGLVGSGFGFSFSGSLDLGLLADSAILVPRVARTLPSFLRHVLRRHVRI